MKNALLISLVFVSIFGWAQIDSVYPIADPVRMTSRINSGAEEDFPLLTHNGGDIYFCRTFHPLNIGGQFAGQDIWCSHKVNDSTWTSASNLFPSSGNEFLNDEYNNVVVGMSTNGDTLYLMNHYHHHRRKLKHHHHHNSTHAGLSYAVYQDSIWLTPQEIKIPHLEFEGHHYGLFMHSSGEVLLISETETEISHGQEDLFVTVKEGNEWSKIINLGDKVNGPAVEFSPFLSADKKYLFFSSDREEGFGGFDLYYSERLDDTWQNWTEPVNLGERINSEHFDAYLSVSDDNHILFVRNETGKPADIYIANIIDPETGKSINEANKDSVLLSTLIDPESYLNMERLVNLDTIVRAKDIIEFDPRVHKDINIDSLIYENALDFVDNVNKSKGFKVVDLKTDEVRHLESDELDSMKIIPRGVTVQFDYNIKSLDDDDRNILSKVVYMLKNEADLTVTITGHTCAIGSERYNRDLSKQRAIAAREYLISKKISPKKVSIKWQGEIKPIATNDTEEGRRKNRRVEISFNR